MRYRCKASALWADHIFNLGRQWDTHQKSNWHAKREKLRKGVSQYYKAKRIARLLARELGVDRAKDINPWEYDSGSMREMAQLLRRSMYALETDRKSLGLTAHQHSIDVNAWENRVITHNRYYKRDVPGLRREIMSVEELAEAHG
jgi:hypothetical protein